MLSMKFILIMFLCDRIFGITNPLSLEVQKKSELVTFFSPVTMATSEQLEDLIETNNLTVVDFHVLMSLLKTTMSVYRRKRRRR